MVKKVDRSGSIPGVMTSIYPRNPWVSRCYNCTGQPLIAIPCCAEATRQYLTLKLSPPDFLCAGLQKIPAEAQALSSWARIWLGVILVASVKHRMPWWLCTGPTRHPYHTKQRGRMHQSFSSSDLFKPSGSVPIPEEAIMNRNASTSPLLHRIPPEIRVFLKIHDL